MTIKQLLQQAQQRLSAAEKLESEDQQNALREAQLLLAHVLDSRRSYLMAYPELELTDTKLSAFYALVEQRCQGIPVAYLLGHREFYGLRLEVNQSVLIPRPETELLVDHALLLLPENGNAADLGTGSGAIAIALAKQRINAHIVATDISADALVLAKKNAARHQLCNIEFYAGDWLKALPDIPGTLDIIVSNPPYVRAGDRHLSQGDCRYEPQLALSPGDNATDALRQIVQQSPAYLKPFGWLLMEHGFDQAADVRAIFDQGPWQNIRTIVDLAGQPRVTMARLSPAAG